MNHEPDPTFASHLEWQIRTALRRRERFAEPARPAGLRRLGVAALVLVSLCVGAGGVMAAEAVQDARERAAAAQRRELLLTQARVQEELARSRLEFAERELERVQLLHDRGFVASSELSAAKREPDYVRIGLELVRLDREEIELTGREPETSLVAPPVAGRDFVSERLELESRRAETTLAEAREQHDHAARLAESGFTSQVEVEGLARELVAADWVLRTARGKIELRSGFLRGLKNADETLLEALRIETRTRYEGQLARVLSLERELGLMRQRAAASAAPAPNRLEAELAQERGRLELLRIELELVEARLGQEPQGLERLRGLGYVR